MRVAHRAGCHRVQGSRLLQTNTLAERNNLTNELTESPQRTAMGQETVAEANVQPDARDWRAMMPLRRWNRGNAACTSRSIQQVYATSADPFGHQSVCPRGSLATHGWASTGRGPPHQRKKPPRGFGHPSSSSESSSEIPIRQLRRDARKGQPCKMRDVGPGGGGMRRMVMPPSPVAPRGGRRVCDPA